jgi:hypothetical protein
MATGWSRRAASLIASVTLLFGVVGPVQATSSPTTPKASTGQAAPTLAPDVTDAVRHDKSPALRSIKPAREGPDSNGNQAPRHLIPRKLEDGAKAGSAKVQSAITTNNMPSFDANFDGVGNVNGVLPPDTQGDVGPDNYVQMINLSFAVFDKQGNLLLGPLDNTTLWQGFGGPCETFNGGDPVTMYDEEADRWFMSQLAYPGGAQGFHQCIAISTTGDPTGAYFRYDFLFSNTTLNDYPKFGVWNDAYYETANEFLNGAVFTGVTASAYERDQMLVGGAARVVRFHVGDTSGIYGGLLPSDAEGQALGFGPPGGAPNPFVMFDDDSFGFSPTDRLLMWDFHVDWTDPLQSTFGNNGVPNRSLETAPFDSNLCNYARNCIPQPGTTQGLDTLADRLMFRAAYRNFGDHQGIALTHSVDADGADHAGIRWYQLDDSGFGWGILDQGTFAPDSDNRWMGSAALDASGDLAVGYSVSSSVTFPSIRAAGRLAGDPAGDLAQGEATLVAGGGSQTHPAARWGDYADLQVDPTDACTYWFTTEYMPTTSVADWHTRVGSFKFPSCTAGPHGDLTGTVTDSSNGDPIEGAVVSTDVAATTTDASGDYSLTLPADTYDVTFSAFGFASETVNGVVITDGGTTTQDAALDPSPAATVSGTVTDGSGHGWPLYTRIDVTGRPGGPVFTNPETGEYSVELPQGATYDVKWTAQLPGYEVLNDQITVGNGNVTHDVALEVDASTCSAPGYHFVFTEALSEDFNGGALPPGWDVTDEVGNGETWTFDDPGGRGNLTGGDGAFAIIDSDHFGPDHTQDSSLVTPAIDLSAAATPIVQFNEDYLAFPTDVIVDVDVSVDGGATWLNAYHNLANRRGPRVNTVEIPQAANAANAKVRWRYASTFGFWWEVDNATIGNRSCDPIDGGLVVGNVYDGNTGSGINGATVTSEDEPADKGTTVATPDDEGLDDGFYMLFSSLTGTHDFTAHKNQYSDSTESVNVAADDATRQDFTLGAGHLVINPTSITKTQLLGSTTTQVVTFQNTGTGAADVTLGERKGSFEILTATGAPLRRVDVKGGSVQKGWLGDNQDLGIPGVNAGLPADPTWTTIAPYPSAIMDNAADQIDGLIYSVGGYNGSDNVASGAVYDPDTDSWSAIASMSAVREKPSAAAIDGLLYVSGGWDNTGTPIAATAAYDPGSDSWTNLAANPAPRAAAGTAVADGKLYLVGGCADGGCTPSNTAVSYDPGTDAWTTLAPYPHPNSWMSCGGIDGLVYCAGGLGGGSPFTDGFVYDPASNAWSPIADMPFNLWGSAYSAANGLLLISSGLSGPATLTNQGLAYDPGTDTWSNLPNAQFPRFRGAGACGFYKVGGSSVAGFSPTPDSEHLSELDQCGITDVPWLAENPGSFTVQPGQTVSVTVTLSATTAAGVDQPGAYTAQLLVKHNTPDTIDPINVTMNVTPPKDWGKVTGTVLGQPCTGAPAPLMGAQVQLNGSGGFMKSLSTNAQGKYAWWAPVKVSPLTIIASKDGWISQTKSKISLKKGKTTTVNFTLLRVVC